MINLSGLAWQALPWVKASGAQWRYALRNAIAMCLALSVAYVPRTARITRASTLVIREMEYVEAALSFLGIGPPPPAPSWGNIIAEGRDYSVEAWWIMLFPGVANSLAALGMNLLGDGLRDVLDPRLKVET